MGQHVLPSSLRRLSARFSSSRAVGLRASPRYLPWEPLSRAAHGAAACFIGASKRGVGVQARSRSPSCIADLDSLAHHKHAFGGKVRSAGPAHTAAEGITEEHGCQALDYRRESFRSWLSWWVDTASSHTCFCRSSPQIASCQEQGPWREHGDHTTLQAVFGRS